MSNSFIFNYDTFYNYYINKANCIKDDSTSTIYFHNSEKYKSPKTTERSKYYILVDNVKIYIKSDGKNKTLLFTIPTVYKNKLYDVHYHFGIKPIDIKIDIDDLVFMDEYNKNNIKQNTKLKIPKNISKRKLVKRNNTKKIREHKNEENKEDIEIIEINEIIGLKEHNPPTKIEEISQIGIDKYQINPDNQLIYFHKTYQHILDISNNTTNNYKGYRTHQPCFFQDNIEIKSIKNIICIQTNLKYMGIQFNTYELEQLNEIIKRPFGVVGGKIKNNKIYSKNKTRKATKI